MEKIYITDQYITLSQLLKLTNLFDSGGFIKNYIQNEGVTVNGTTEYKRGRKLYHMDTVEPGSAHTFMVIVENRG